MNRHLTITLVGLITSVATLTAIPDRVGVFVANSNQRVEDFVFDEDTWSEGAELPSDWEQQTATEETLEDVYQTKTPFIVFGVKAEKVLAVKLDGDLSRFLVTYRPDRKAKATTGSLVKALLTNIEAYTGKSLVKSGGVDNAGAGGYRGHYKDFEIHLSKRPQDEVLVAIRRVPA